jgi:hypothetical protein
MLDWMRHHASMSQLWCILGTLNVAISMLVIFPLMSRMFWEPAGATSFRQQITASPAMGVLLALVMFVAGPFLAPFTFLIGAVLLAGATIGIIIGLLLWMAS